MTSSAPLSKALRIIIADDHPLVREGMRHILVALASTVTVIETETFAETVAVLRREPDTDLALLDLAMSDADGLDGVGAVLAAAPAVPVVMLSGSQDAHQIRRCLDLGVMGYVSKNEPVAIMLSALRLVLNGGIYVPVQALQRTVVSGGQSPSSAALTPRQTDVLRLLMLGRANKEIGQKLGLTEATVKVHVSAVLRALNAENRTQATRAAAKLGLL